MRRNSPKIVIISPCRNEARYLPSVIRDVAEQTLRPVEWIIVDDGSSDATANIVREASSNHPWIRLVTKPNRGERSVGPGVVEAFYVGFERLETKDWDYICKLDADLRLGPFYFSRLLQYFRQDTHLGAASGKLFLQLDNGKLIEERNSDEAVWGCANFYRRQCFDDVGGFVREVMWDGIVFHRARMEGWRTRSIRDPELRIIDRRIMGSSYKGVLYGRRRWGRGQYFMGTHPLFILAVGLYRMAEQPVVAGGVAIVLGYLGAMVRGVQRYRHPEFRRSLHAWQFERLRIGKRLEKIPSPPRGLYW